MTSDTIILRDLTTGAGRTGLTVSLYKWNGSAWVSAAVASEVSGKPGAYEFVDLPFLKYKLYVGSEEEKSFGGENGRYLGSSGPIPVERIPTAIPSENIGDGTVSTAEFKTVDGSSSSIQTQLDSKLPKSGGIVTGVINCGTNPIYCSTNPTLSASVVNMYTLQWLALQLSGGTMSGTIDMAGYKITNLPDPLAAADPVTKGFLEYVIQNYLTGNTTVYQQGVNILRVLYSGTQENNRVYRTVSNALNVAYNAPAGSGKQITCQIEGNGTSGNLLSNHNSVSPSDIHLFCHLMGVTPDVDIIVNDDTYEVGLVTGDRGKTIFKNLIIRLATSDATPVFRRFVFEDCRFEMASQASSISLDDCELRGFNYFKTPALSMTNVKGSMYYTNVIPNETGTNPTYIVSNNF